MSYKLLFEDGREILEVLEMAVSTVSGMKIFTALSGNKALAVISSHGAPALIVSDYPMPDGDGVGLYRSIQTNHPDVPFIVCTGNPAEELKKIFPASFDVVSKPQFIKPLKAAVLKKFPQVDIKKEFLQISVGFLLRQGVVEVDAYIKISEEKYVKIHSSGDMFDKSDADRLFENSLTTFYVFKADALLMADKFENFGIQEMSVEGDNKDDFSLTFNDLETTHAFSLTLGCNEDTVRLAFKAVNLTVNMVKRDQSWTKPLAQKKSNSFYSHHVSLLSKIVCIVAQNIGWSSETTQQKLTLVALLHDQFVDETTNEILQQNSNDSSEIIQNPEYRQHPIKIAEFARSLRGLPNDVDHILLQHHELPDGPGFPRGLVASQISPFSAVFIVSEELLHFSHGKVIDKNMLNEFWGTFPEFLHKEPFKRSLYQSLTKSKYASTSTSFA